MTRALTRTSFHSSKLIRTLADLALLEAAEPAPAMAEKLGLWIAFTDAIALSGVHNASTANPPDTPSRARGVAGAALEEDFTRTRTGLENTITQSARPLVGRARAELALPRLDGPLEDATAYVPLRRYHQAHQRDMETHVRSLRTRVRDGVAKASPQLQQLVALDGAFDGILRGRETKLLSTIPSLLEKRFHHLRQAHQQTLRDSQQTNTSDAWTQPGAWLARFCSELQAVLLAELDLRLQPVVGLLEALHNEKTNQL